MCPGPKPLSSPQQSPRGIDNNFRDNYITTYMKEKKNTYINPISNWKLYETWNGIFFLHMKVMFSTAEPLPFICSLCLLLHAFSSLRKPCSTNIILVRVAITNTELLHSFFAEFEQLQPDQVFLCYMRIQK